ncbi:MFS transporter [Glycomyces sp. A-F 0318]|uniref:MFS transporter n=1 Tax=Glycomyces amatae TaxID=2881355 RepID=UPI001E36FCDC|nr:MFS transporter [Glycomyces amatae]MCD0442066.1 MFS transporter [Glycomyces amatae]
MSVNAALAIDFGTSNTVAVLRRPGSADRPLLFSGSPVMPSAVFLDADGRFHTGREAHRMAQLDPAAFEPHPKQRIGDDLVLLGDREVPAVDLAAAVLGRVKRAAVEVVGEAPPAVLTHPAPWGPRRTAALERAAAAAGLDVVRLVAEPVAAAHRFARIEADTAAGPIGVFDLGGGTFDIAVLRRDRTGRLAVAAQGGRADLGGVDLDQAIIDHLGELTTRHHPELWRRISGPLTAADRRAHRLFRDDVREAKEMLSQSSMAPIALPGLDTALHLTRDEVDRLAAPLVEAAVAVTVRVLGEAGCAPSDLAGLFLVGGASRMPLVGRALHRRLGTAPTVLEQPELAVAQGALDAAAQPAASPEPEPPAPPPTHRPAPDLGARPPVPLPPPPRRPPRSPAFAAGLGAFTVLADFTASIIAAPTIGRDLGASAAALPWVAGGFALALSVLLPPLGSLADRWGLKRTYLAGLAGFAAAALLCTRASDVEALVAGRLLQGAAAAVVLAPAIALLHRARRDRGRAPSFGVWGAVAAAAAVTGLILGGMLTGSLGWRAVFVAEALAGLFAVVVGAVAVTEPRRTGEGRLDLRLLARPGFAGAVLAALLVSAAAFAGLVHLSAWVQSREVGLGPGGNVPVAAVRVPLLIVAAAFAAAMVSARTLRRVPPWIGVGLGLALVGAGGFLLSGAVTGGLTADDWRSSVPGLLVTGVGVGLCVPALNAAAAAAVPKGREALAAVVLNASGQAGLVLGLAVLGAVFTSHPLGPGDTGPLFTTHFLDGADVVNALRPTMLAAGWIALAGAVPAALLLSRTRRPAGHRDEPSPAAGGERPDPPGGDRSADR